MQVTPIILGGANPLNARLALSGNYFRLLISTAAVTIRLYRKGRPFSEAATMLAGYWSAPTAGFDEVEVISAGAQTVYIGTADGLGGYDRAAGDFNITGNVGSPVTVQGPRIMSGVPVVGDLPLLMRDMGFSYGAKQSSITNIAGGGTELVLAAGGNTNGVIVWAAETYTIPAGAAANLCISLHAHTVAPAAYTDGDPLLTNFTNESTAAGMVGGTVAMNRSIFVAAGKGLWWLNSSAGAEGIARRKVLYTVL